MREHKANQETKLNQRLQAARDQGMWSLEEAAEKVGVDAQTFWRWEHYVQWPRPYALRKLCVVFGKPAEELGFGPDDAQRSRESLEETTSNKGINDGALLPTTRVVHTQDSLLVRLTPGQVDAFLALLEDEATMRQFDPAKRETLQKLLAAGRGLLAADVARTGFQCVDPDLWERSSVAHAKPSALNSTTLNRFECYLGDCWELSNQNELEIAEDILSSFLPKILALSPREVNSRIAYLASQGLRLQSVLVHHRLNVSNKVLICQQAVDYALHANDPNTLVTALIELAAAFKFEGQLEKRLSTLQEALGYGVHASPLVRSRVYSNSASALAESGRIQEAQLYIKLAREVFPDDPVSDPGFALADSSIFTLSYHAGKVSTYAGNLAEAFDAFELYKRHAPEIGIPERIRLEIVNAQSRAVIQVGDLERYVHFFESAITGAVTLGSKKRFDEALTIFQREAPKTWLANGQIKGIVEKYHLERKG